MRIEQLLELLRAEPFEPFDLILPNGERLHVPHQDFVQVMPDRRTVAVAIREGVAHFVNWALVVGLEKPAVMGS